MRIAIIDLGTNSIRFDVHELKGQRETSLIHREKLMVRLGENVFITGHLDSRAVRRTVEAFDHFKHVSNNLRVDRIVAFATSAMREASDSRQMLQRIRRQTGISLKVISGEEEARLIAQGILKREKMARGSFGLLDIGGGSTEVSVCQEGKLLRGESFPLGVARLQQIFLKSSPPEGGQKSVRRLRDHIRTLLEGKIEEEKWPSVSKIIGSSGTMRTLSRMSRRQRGSKFIERDWLKELADRMTELTVRQIASLEGMEPKRADLILAGTLVLDEAMRALDAKQAVATDYSLRDGILDHELMWLTPARKNRSIDDFMDKAEKFGVSKARQRWLLQMTDLVFDKTKALHQLSAEWRNYLRVAALFRDVGKNISPIGHAQHTYYIIKNSDLFFSEPWETEFVAQLCLQQETDKIEPFPESVPLSQARQQVFAKLVGLLQILGAVDAAYPRKVKLGRTQVVGRSFSIKLLPGPSTELVLLKLQQRKELLEAVFKRHLRSDGN